MKIIENFKEGVRNSMREFLQIEDNNSTSFNIKEEMNEETWLFKNEILYRQKPSELSEFYKNLNLHDNNFWSCVPAKGMGTIKVASGLPKLIVDVISNMVTRDLNNIITDDKYQNLIDETLKENEFKKMINNALKQAISQGDGVFTFVIDREISQYPILQFYPAKQVKYKKRYGRIIEITTTDKIKYNTHNYFLKTDYGFGYRKYRLVDSYGKDCSNLLGIIEETEFLQDDYDLPKNLILAVPFFPIGYSSIYNNRGKSIYEGKDNIYFALDEIVSNWVSAIRKSQAYKTIDKKSIPINPETGEPIYSSNDFDNIFIEVDTPRSENNHVAPINIYQPEIPSDNYKSAYSVFLELALSGDMSASDLGIDSDKINANAKSEKERKQSTFYLRNMILESLEETIKKIIYTIVNIQNLWDGNNNLLDVDVEVNFSDYSSPSWEIQVATLISMYKAGIISLESLLEELYGDDKDADWKKEELERILKDNNINKNNIENEEQEEVEDDKELQYNNK